MGDIFISYARADKQQATLLAEKLIEQGWSVWWDREIPPGKSFDETIENALNSAKCIIVLWSQNSTSSRWVKTEAAEGAERGILVPVLIDKANIPLEFKRIEAADLSDWRGKPSHPEFNHLLKTIDKLLSNVATPRTKPNRSALLKQQLLRWWKMMLKIIGISLGLAAFVFIVIGLDKLGVFERISHISKVDSISSTNTNAHQNDNTASVTILAAKTQSIATNQQSVQPEKTVITTEIQGSEQFPITGTAVNHDPINLLSLENGGQLLAAPNDDWMSTIDGKEGPNPITFGEAVYGFKNELPAIFNIFTMLINVASEVNVKEFELLAGNDTPTGAFELIGKFQTQNLKLYKSPYQEFKFKSVTAKYLKVRILSCYSDNSSYCPGVYSPKASEFQLFGSFL